MQALRKHQLGFNVITIFINTMQDQLFIYASFSLFSSNLEINITFRMGHSLITVHLVTAALLRRTLSCQAGLAAQALFLLGHHRCSMMQTWQIKNCLAEKRGGNLWVSHLVCGSGEVLLCVVQSCCSQCHQPVWKGWCWECTNPHPNLHQGNIKGVAGRICEVRHFTS